jgi:hypothetical protein
MAIRWSILETNGLLTVGLRQLKIRGTAMRFRILFVCALGLTVGISASPSYAARGIRTDDTIGCQSTVNPLAGGGIALPSDGSSVANSANPGVSSSDTIWSCSDVNPDPLLLGGLEGNGLSYSNVSLYTWFPLPSTNYPNAYSGDFLSNQSDDGTPPPDAQVAVFQLTGSLTGDEVQFNYDTCNTSPASLTWFGHTYTGAGSLCGTTNTNDFLFNNSTGALIGYFNESGNETPGCPPGWTCPTATSVPEPDTLALLGCTAIPMLLFFRGRVRRPRRARSE